MIKEILDKVKGLAYLLWAASLLSENRDSLRAKGVIVLASIASDIERDLEDLTSGN